MRLSLRTPRAAPTPQLFHNIDCRSPSLSSTISPNSTTSPSELQLSSTSTSSRISLAMADQVQELLEIPKEFLRSGTQFLTRCTKPDKQEFLTITRAVGVGFVVMGAVGYFVKLGMIIPFQV
ncbi:translocation complex subunit sss1 [Phlyctema vagabunda]|uniref:Translocation complex subunit sss1 n=1 Tax=Phlyctema vagabunda TaxID=108571 RepID=A0ABR4PF03_9HELO